MKSVKQWFRRPIAHASNDKCFYCKGEKADGKAYQINLLKITDIKARSFGVMDHQSSFKKKDKLLVVPRSTKAQFIHRISAVLKVLIILTSLIFFRSPAFSGDLFSAY